MPLLFLVYPVIIRCIDYVVKYASLGTGNRGGGDRTPDFLFPKQTRYLCATPRYDRFLSPPVLNLSEGNCRSWVVSLSTELIILLFVPLVKWFPVLPPILMNCPHTQDGNKDKRKSHHTQTPGCFHYCSSNMTKFVHHPRYLPGHVKCIPLQSNNIKVNTNKVLMLDSPT